MSRLTPKKIILSTIAAIITLLSANSAKAQLNGFGPTDPSNGYPAWYQDSLGTRLELCLNPQDPFCPALAAPFDGVQPLSFASNFPAEVFYFLADNRLTTNRGGSLRVRLSIEAAFLGGGNPQPGFQVTFGRVRVTGSGLPAGQYRVTHPYGVQVFSVNTSGAIQFTQDVAPLLHDYSTTLNTTIGPFLAWDPRVAPAAPTGYLGNPAVTHTVVGSPLGTNFVKIEDITGVNAITVGLSNRFTIAGKLSTPHVLMSPNAGTYSTPIIATFVSSDPNTAVSYTIDGSDPKTSRTRNTAAGNLSLPISKTTALRAVATDGRGHFSAETAKTYTINPNFFAVYALPKGDLYDHFPVVTLKSFGPSSTIFYTLDGTNPKTSFTRQIYRAPLTVGPNGRHKLLFYAAANNGATTTVFEESYAVYAPQTSPGPAIAIHKFPAFYKDARGLSLDLCLDPNDPFCVPVALPFPGNPVSFPQNFPTEAFYFNADNRLTTTDRVSVRLTYAMEATFFGGAPPAEGLQTTFGRVRIRTGNLALGLYRITHPYGVEYFNVTNNNSRSIDFTEDFAPLLNDFVTSGRSHIGPFLYWNPAVAPAAPLGYVGNPAVAHQVLGSPFGNNFVRVERLTAAGATVIGFSDAFSIAGKISR
jgi:hypothetical protein